MPSTEDPGAKMPKQAAELKRLNEAAIAELTKGDKAAAQKLLEEQAALLGQIIGKLLERKAARKAKRESQA